MELKLLYILLTVLSSPSFGAPAAYDYYDYDADYYAAQEDAEKQEMKQLLAAPPPITCDQAQCVCEDTVHLVKEVYKCDRVCNFLSHFFP